MDAIVRFQNVHIDYPLKKYTLHAVSDVSIDIARGKITALVGESGSGKTTLSSALIRCISEPGVIASGEILFCGKDEEPIHVEKLTEKELQSFRWKRVSMVFQAAQSALNPVMTVKEQFLETMEEHGDTSPAAQKENRCKELLEYVKLDPDRILKAYPHELSGGMKQRVMIAFSLLLDPDLIILDEPTTALDVITQSYIFSILKEINREKGISMLIMTHDISIVAKFADYVGVMYGGKLMEFGAVRDVFKKRRHPYTEGLIGATPSIIHDISAIKPIEGTPPDIMNLPEGCVFWPRCVYFEERCRQQEPDTVVYPDGSKCKCLLEGR